MLAPGLDPQVKYTKYCRRSLPSPHGAHPHSLPNPGNALPAVFTKKHLSLGQPPNSLQKAKCQTSLQIQCLLVPIPGMSAPGQPFQRMS